MEPVREEDHVGAVCYRASGELYLGNRRGRIGNEGGFKEDQIADYDFAGTAGRELFLRERAVGLDRGVLRGGGNRAA